MPVGRRSDHGLVEVELGVAELGLELVPIPVRSEAEVVEKIDELDGKVDLLWSVADPTVFTPQSVRYILLHTLRSKIPLIGLSPSYVRAGALMSLSADYRDVGRQSGEQAVRILQEGDLQRNAFDLSDPDDFAKLSGGAILYSSIFQAAFHQLSGDRDVDKWSFELVTEFDVNDDVMLYGSLKQGNKSGGFDVRSNSEPDPGTTGAGVLFPASLEDTVASNVDPGSFEFDDEEALAFEVGSKLVLAGGAADLSLALFYTRAGRLEAAERQFRDLLAVRKERTPEGWQYFTAQSGLGEVLTLQERFEEAEPFLLRSYETLEEDRSLAAPALERVQRLYQLWGKPDAWRGSQKN